MLFAFRRQHYLCISAPAMPLPPSPPLPGPGHYNLVNYEGEPRRYVTSSVFVSTTNRLVGQELQDNESEPGPGEKPILIPLLSVPVFM